MLASGTTGVFTMNVEEFVGNQLDEWIIAFIDIQLQVELYGKVYEYHDDYFEKFQLIREELKKEHGGNS